MQLGRIVVSTLSSPQLRDILSCSELSDTALARRALVRQQADVAVVIPAGFSRAVLDSAGRAEVLLADPVKTIGPAIVQASCSGCSMVCPVPRFSEHLSQCRAASGVAPDSRAIAALMQQYQEAAQGGSEPVEVRAPGPERTSRPCSAG